MKLTAYTHGFALIVLLRYYDVNRTILNIESLRSQKTFLVVPTCEKYKF